MHSICGEEEEAEEAEAEEEEAEEEEAKHASTQKETRRPDRVWASGAGRLGGHGHGIYWSLWPSDPSYSLFHNSLSPRGRLLARAVPIHRQVCLQPTINPHCPIYC